MHFDLTLTCFNPTFKCQSVVLMMLLCVNLLKSATLARIKRYLPTPLVNWKVNRRSLVLQSKYSPEWRFYLLVYLGDRWDPVPLVVSWADKNKMISRKIFLLITYKISEWRWTFQFFNGVGRCLFIQSRVRLFNRIMHSSIIRTIRWSFSVVLKQIRVYENARMCIWIPHRRYYCCYLNRGPSISG